MPIASTLAPPRVYMNGFPKSGLHLAERMAITMTRPFAFNKGWFGTNAWGIERASLDKAALVFGGLPQGYYLRGHMGYLKSLEALLAGLNIACMFVYRDLRDVAVSQLHHILSDDDEKKKHPDKAFYRAMGSEEDMLIAIIAGAGKFPGLIERWETYAQWLESPYVLPMSFERMRRLPRQAAMDFIDHVISVAFLDAGYDTAIVGDDVRRQIADGMVQAMQTNPEASPTFRKGKVGGWTKRFTPRVKQAFVDSGGADWLITLGYEKDTAWL